MVDEILGVVNVNPVSNDDPPVAAEYQLMVPELGVALIKTVPVPHLEPGVVAVIVGIVLTVAVTAVREALVQPDDTAST